MFPENPRNKSGKYAEFGRLVLEGAKAVKLYFNSKTSVNDNDIAKAADYLQKLFEYNTLNADEKKYVQDLIVTIIQKAREAVDKNKTKE